MADKKNDIITKYLADMIGVEGHIYQAIDKQVKETRDEPDVNPLLQNISSTLERHVAALGRRLEELGGQPTSPLKEAGASVLGVAAGVIDKLRAEEKSKDFRDNYTALSLSNISYEMLITTALAVGDRPTAELAANHMRENTRFVMQIAEMIPQIVVNDLSDLTNLNQNAATEARQMYSDVWNQNQQ
jgi:ferritin-like metal-binding protein YciE